MAQSKTSWEEEWVREKEVVNELKLYACHSVLESRDNESTVIAILLKMFLEKILQ